MGTKQHPAPNCVLTSYEAKRFDDLTNLNISLFFFLSLSLSICVCVCVSVCVFGEIQVVRRQKAISEKEELERDKAKAAEERKKAAKKQELEKKKVHYLLGYRQV